MCMEFYFIKTLGVYLNGGKEKNTPKPFFYDLRAIRIQTDYLSASEFIFKTPTECHNSTSPDVYIDIKHMICIYI